VNVSYTDADAISDSTTADASGSERLKSGCCVFFPDEVVIESVDTGTADSLADEAEEEGEEPSAPVGRL